MDYKETRAQGVEQINALIEARVLELNNLLASAAKYQWSIDFERLKDPMPPSTDPNAFRVPEPGFLMKTFGVGRDTYAATLDQKQTEYQLAVQERSRLVELVERQHGEVDAYRTGFEAGDPREVVEYFTDVLANLPLPEDFPEGAKVGWVPESKQLVVEVELPGLAVIPAETSFRYIKTRDAVEPKARPDRERRAIYTLVVAQLALRALHAIYSADAPHDSCHRGRPPLQATAGGWYLMGVQSVGDRLEALTATSLPQDYRCGFAGHVDRPAEPNTRSPLHRQSILPNPHFNCFPFDGAVPLRCHPAASTAPWPPFEHYPRHRGQRRA